MLLSDFLGADAAGRCGVMGILNVTEDSFSDGGRWLDLDDALAQAHRLIAAGADVIDVGGESTRPGAQRVDAELEVERIVPVIQRLTEEGIRVSVDTMRARTAVAAVDAGALMINDVSGGLADPDMYRVMAESGVAVCLMHWRTVDGGEFVEASGHAHHGGDVLEDVRQVLSQLAHNAIDAGVDPQAVVVDPGLGFSKTAEENWAILAGLPELVADGRPVLVGASRKRFLAAVRKERGMKAVYADPATAAVSALSASAGAWAVRVHDAALNRDAVDVAARWQAASPRQAKVRKGEA